MSFPMASSQPYLLHYSQAHSDKYEMSWVFIVRISCIIPTRDRCQMVLEAIESARKQNHDQMEIIVVDDGSEDNTLAQVNALFPGVITIRLAGVGPGAARNAGVAAATGDVLMFLDSDDIWLAGHVTRLAETLGRGFQVAYGTALTQNEVDGSAFLIPENGGGPEGDCFEALSRWCFLVPSALALTREAFRHSGGFADVAFGEDWLFCLKLAARLPFGFAGPEPVTLRKLHPGSLCFLADKKKLIAITGQLLRVLENEPRAAAKSLEHCKMVHDWTAANLLQWSTVQEWYLALRQEKMI